jgi:hypothetical protein
MNEKIDVPTIITNGLLTCSTLLLIFTSFQEIPNVSIMIVSYAILLIAVVMITIKHLTNFVNALGMKQPNLLHLFIFTLPYILMIYNKIQMIQMLNKYRHEITNNLVSSQYNTYSIVGKIINFVQIRLLALNDITPFSNALLLLLSMLHYVNTHILYTILNTNNIDG